MHTACGIKIFPRIILREKCSKICVVQVIYVWTDRCITLARGGGGGGGPDVTKAFTHT